MNENVSLLICAEEGTIIHNHHGKEKSRLALYVLNQLNIVPEHVETRGLYNKTQQPTMEQVSPSLEFETFFLCDKYIYVLPANLQTSFYYNHPSSSRLLTNNFPTATLLLVVFLVAEQAQHLYCPTPPVNQWCIALCHLNLKKKLYVFIKTGIFHFLAKTCLEGKIMMLPC